MPTYRIAQDAGSIGDADDCWSIYKKEDDFEEVIAVVQTEGLANRFVECLKDDSTIASIIFPTREMACEFARDYSRHTLRGHSISAGDTDVEVALDGLSDEDKKWINERVASLNSDN